MPSIRISIRGLIGLILIASLWIAALARATELWVTITDTLTLGLLLMAILGTFIHRGKSRCFWAGFALFGFTHLFLTHWAFGIQNSASGLTTGLHAPANWVHPAPPVPPSSFPGGFSPSPAQIAEFQHRDVVRNFESIARHGLCPAFALASGLIGFYFASDTPRATSSSPDEPPTHGR